MNIPKNTVCLWYEKDAQAAAEFYAATFPDSKVGAIQKAPSDFPDGKAGDVLVFAGLGHVGLYVGHGRMVHAPHAGARVEKYKLRGSYWGHRIVSVRRIARR